jgi:KDO2-lipid IV(A) lauroyltransferase
MRRRIEYWLALVVLRTLEWSPRPVALALARLYVRLLDWMIPRLRRVGLRNLQMAMPMLKRRQRHQVIDGVFQSIARMLVTFAKFPGIRKSNLRHWMRLEGMEHFDQAKAAGRGVLFATAHLGNWELSAFAHALVNGPMHVVARPLDHPAIDALVEQRRQISGNRVISKHDAARTILKALHANEAVGVLTDQNAAIEEGVFVNFFGVPACANKAFVRLAAHSGAAVILGFALWSEREGRYVLRFYPPIPMTGDVTRDTQALHTKLEEVIRAFPDQWMWIHRRWKTRPPGELIDGVRRA